MMDWTTFTRRITVKATRRDAWMKWMTGTEIESWFLKSAAFFHPDDVALSSDQRIYPGCRYEWIWYTYDDYLGAGEILAIEEDALVSFTFDQCRVDVRFEDNPEIEGEIIVALTQSKIPTDDASKHRLYVGCSTGWTYHLTNLKCMLEGGPDLRSEHTSGVLNN